MIFFFFKNIDICFLIPAVIAQFFNPIAKPTVTIEITTNKVKANFEKHQVIKNSLKNSL